MALSSSRALSKQMFTSFRRNNIFRASSRSFFADSRGGGYRPGKATENLPVNYGVRIVPQQQAWVVERFGQFHEVLTPGLKLLIPIVDRISYVHSLKEEAIEVPGQMAITKDNVTLEIDGVLFLQVNDPVKASYGVEDAIFAVIQLAQTTMRSELGKMKMDTVFQDRENLNTNIVETINNAAEAWGISVLRYEIRDITPPENIRTAMELQAEAERRKRADILASEGEQQATINIAEGKRQQVVKAAEADGEAIEINANATAIGVEKLAHAVNGAGGANAVALRVAEQYVDAFASLAKKSTTVVLPADVGNVSNMVTQALTTYGAISKSTNDASIANLAGHENSKIEENEKVKKKEISKHEFIPKPFDR